MSFPSEAHAQESGGRMLRSLCAESERSEARQDAFGETLKDSRLASGSVIAHEY